MGISTGRPRGRPPGARNKRTTESLARMQEAAERLSKVMPEAFQGDAHALLMSVYKDPTQPIAVRIEAAGKAMRPVIFAASSRLVLLPATALTKSFVEARMNAL